MDRVQARGLHGRVERPEEAPGQAESGRYAGPLPRQRDRQRVSEWRTTAGNIGEQRLTEAPADDS